MPMTPSLEVTDGAVAIGGRPILRGIDFSARGGEVVALLGSNGSGKSTLIRACMGRLPLTRGEIRLFGVPLARFHDWRRVGYVPQRTTAASGVPATVWEVVASGRLARRRWLTPLRRDDRTAIAHAIETVGLLHRRNDEVSTLSGGQQQRVLIARALAGQPELFVLDEPTAGVDLHSQHALSDTLREIIARGATVVLVAHELGPLESLIDRTVVVRDGRIAYDGPPQPGDGMAAFHSHAHPGEGEPPDRQPLGEGGPL
ncbi:MAG: ATP-binding cassette domain-containing protein [Propionibacteriales bacterium]|nr:ATP-binding cassette domain-containing protein [Propionibacteriales bacterium]